jgi:hypothetical protein
VASVPTERIPLPRAHSAPEAQSDEAPRDGRGLPEYAQTWLLTALVAGIVCFTTFYAKGGLNLESMTTVEIALTLAAGVFVAAVVLLVDAPGRRWGIWSVGLMLAFTALTALSVVWSVQPSASWQDANRMLAYTAVFAAAVAAVRLAPGRWQAVIGGVTLAGLIVCGYAVLCKVFPADLEPANTYARLKAPFGYWNAIGLAAAMAAIGCLWLGARRHGHALLSAMAYPGMGLALLTLALAYSRGALAALAVGVVVWMCIVPLRLRGAAVLIAGGVCAAAVAAWDFTNHALSSEGIAMAQRTTAGHQLGVLVLAMLIVLALVGIAAGFSTGRRAPRPLARRRAGAALLAVLAVAVLAFAAALAHSHRGFTGTISHDVSSLTDPNARTPPNTPGRFTAVASVRARYWKEALQVFSAHPALGAGAMGYQTARLRYRTAPLVVAHAHGFFVQTLADLGLVGLGIALALLAVWLAAAGRATHPFDRRWTPWSAWRGVRSGGERPGWRRLPEDLAGYTAERIGLLSMLCIVVVFGAHSLVDWTWYVPGNAIVALLCAGWLVGRGELAPAPAAAGAPAGAVDDPHPDRLRSTRPRSLGELGNARLAAAGAIVAGVLLAAWSQWQPQRSEDARQHALEIAATNPVGALAAAHHAVSINPLSPLALITLADVQQLAGRPAAARATLQKAVREQPSNPLTWLALGRYDLRTNPTAALTELRAAIYLDPQSIAHELLVPPRSDREAIAIYDDYVQALRATSAPRPRR